MINSLQSDTGVRRWHVISNIRVDTVATTRSVDAARDGDLLLLSAATGDRNNAVVLRDYLLMKLSRTGADEGNTDSSG